MATETTNYKLIKPAQEDFYNVDDFNTNADKIDSVISEHAKDYTNHVPYGVASGANAKAVALNPAPKALVEGMALSFKNATLNTGAVTLNVNGLGAKPVIKGNGGPVLSGNLKASSIYTVRYNGASFILQGEGGEYGNVTPPDVVLGKIFGTESGLMTGTATVQTLGGKRWASGTIPRQTPRIVSGLAFTPRTIAMSMPGQTYGASYSAEEGGFNLATINNGLLKIETDGFLISDGIAHNTQDTRWVAFE